MASQQRKFSKAKIIILGAEGVGKTEVLYTHKASIDGNEVSVDILDTANDVSDETLETHIKWADGFVLIYSITDRASLTRLQQLHQFIHLLRCHDDETCVPMVIIGNKTDQMMARVVSSSDVKEIADKSKDVLWSEISVAESKDDVLGAMEELLRQVKKETLKNAEIFRKSPFPSMKKVFKKKVARSRSDNFFR